MTSPHSDSQVKFICMLDSETTTNIPWLAALLSFHAQVVSLDEGDVKFGMRAPSHLLMPSPPDYPTSPDAFLVHGLTAQRMEEKAAYPRDLLTGKPPATLTTDFDGAVMVHGWVQKALAQAPMAFVGWNSNFDFSVLDKWFERNLLPPLFTRYGKGVPYQADLMRMYSAMQFWYPESFPQALKENGNVTRKLQNACRSVGIQAHAGTAHDVVDDVEIFAMGMFQEMWMRDPERMQHMLESSSWRNVQQRLRKGGIAPLYHVNTSGNVAYGQWIIPIPLPYERNWKAFPRHEREWVCAINLSAMNGEQLARLAAMKGAELDDAVAVALRRVSEKTGNMISVKRAATMQDAKEFMELPLTKISLRDHEILFDAGLQNRFALPPSGEHVAAAQSLARNRGFQWRVHGALARVYGDDPIPAGASAHVKALRAAFHATDEWEKRAVLMRDMAGKDRMHAMRILVQHAPDMLRREDFVEWQTYLESQLNPPELNAHGEKPKNAGVTLPSIRAALVKLQQNQDPQTEAELGHYIQHELPRILGGLHMAITRGRASSLPLRRFEV